MPMFCGQRARSMAGRLLQMRHRRRGEVSAARDASAAEYRARFFQIWLEEARHMRSKSQHPYRYGGAPAEIDRRKFLGALGAGVAAFGGSGLFGAPSALAQRHRSSFVLSEENFGRLFPQLEAFFGDRPPRGLNAALVEIGRR